MFLKGTFPDKAPRFPTKLKCMKILKTTMETFDSFVMQSKLLLKKDVVFQQFPHLLKDSIDYAKMNYF